MARDWGPSHFGIAAGELSQVVEHSMTLPHSSVKRYFNNFKIIAMVVFAYLVSFTSLIPLIGVLEGRCHIILKSKN